MPTDGLRTLRDSMREAQTIGLATLQENQIELGRRVRAVLESRGIHSVAARGFQAPGVVVSFTGDDQIKNGARFREAGLQIAAGVPLMCDEPASFKTFRIGLFGLDKLTDVGRTVATFERALDEVIG